MKQCDNGHFYDEARFESCPYCKENTGIGKTMAAANIGKTVAAFPGNPAAAAATGQRCYPGPGDDRQDQPPGSRQCPHL